MIQRTAYTKAYLMIQVPFTLYFSPLENSEASVQNVQELYPKCPLQLTPYCIYSNGQREVKIFTVLWEEHRKITVQIFYR